MRRIDLTGQRYGRLTVIGEEKNRRKKTVWKCRCDCGNIVDIMTTNLRRGLTLSCGCLQKERTRQSKLLNLTGQRFGRLTVVKQGENRGKNVTWICQCDCGRKTEVATNKLRNGNTLSCGCHREEIRTKHGLWGTRLYTIWGNMVQRCTNSNNNNYSKYGGRGISICDDWRNDFQSFYNWAIANGYSDDLQIDRINNDGNYEPSNCRWVTAINNLNNTSRNVKITFKGETHTMSEWARITGINEKTIRNRIISGKLPEEVFKN